MAVVQVANSGILLPEHSNLPWRLQVFHAGTSGGESDDIIATGGRVLAVTALADTVKAAQAKAYKVSYMPSCS